MEGASVEESGARIVLVEREGSNTMDMIAVMNVSYELCDAIF